MSERTFDYTSMSTFQSCPKKYYWRMIRHLTPVTVAPALEFGKAIHLALEIYYIFKNMGYTVESAMDNAIRAFYEVYEDREGEDRRTLANGEKLLRGYAEVYANEPFKVVGTEVGFAVPIDYKNSEGENKSFILVGRIDALVNWNGPLYVLETKSTAQLGYGYFNQFEMNQQMDGYLWGAMLSTGEKVQGVIINTLEVWKDVKRVSEKTKKLEDHYARDPQTRSDFELEEYKNDMGMQVENILDAEKRNRFPRNKQNCYTYNSRCPYWNLCKYGEDAKTIARDFVESKWEPYKQEVAE